MDQYINYIENLAIHNESMVFANSGKEHASIVFSTIFRHARNEVFIAAGNMNGQISNTKEYLDNLKSFLTQGGKLKLMLAEFAEANNTDLFELLKYFKFFNDESVEIRVNPKGFINRETSSTVHFCVADDKMYRFEYDTKNYAASGSFNSPEVASSLKKAFLHAFDNSNAVAY